MGKREEQNRIVFIVEGQSDREALRDIAFLYTHSDESIDDVAFLIADEKDEERSDESDKKEGGDITSSYWYENERGESERITPENFPNYIGPMLYKMYLLRYLKNERCMLKDIKKIIHIVDTDGAFISDDNVLSDQSCEKTFYAEKENKIRCKDAKKIKERNRHKRQILQYLIGLEKIQIKSRKIDYSIYYFSCNLDHFLHNSANLGQKEKCEKARGFAGRETWEFVEFFLKNPYAVHGMDYQESWEYIQQGNNSLQRHTNINLLLEKLLEKIKKN